MYSAINGTKLFYDTEGSLLRVNGNSYEENPTLIMLHGGPGSDHAYSRPSLSSLSESAYVVYLDQRNQGNSQRESFQAFTLSQLANDLHEFCKVHSIKKPYIFGHSFGGMVAIEYAGQFKEEIGGLILSGTFATMKHSEMFSMFEKLGGNSARKSAEAFWLHPTLQSLEKYKSEAVFCTSRKWPSDIGQRNKRCNSNSELCAYFWAGEGMAINLVEKLHAISCKTLVLAGDSDPVSPPECAEEIYSQIRTGLAEKLLLENCGHMFWYDQPEIGISAIKKFICGVSGNA